jgi:hypothetical protein
MTSQTTQQMWIKTRDNRTGRQVAVLVPSASMPNKYHVVTSQSCDCKGFSFRQTCSHLRAVQAEIAARSSKPIPAESIPDGFTTAPPVDGTLGELARRQKLVTLADSIWGTDGD